MGFYDFTLKDGKGNDVSTASFRDKVVLVVNTATGCGFTPQYEEIEKWYEAYHDQGLEILDIPCNQFYGQAPGSDEEIHEFCQLHYNTKFPQMKKSDVNGADTIPLYKFLKSEKGFKGFPENDMAEKMNSLLASIDPDYKNNSEIKWNFTKFIVDRSGKVVARFEPSEDTKLVEDCIKSLL